MKKVTRLVLMPCLVLSAAFCYTHGVARTENEKGNEGKVRKALRFQPLDRPFRSLLEMSKLDDCIDISIDKRNISVFSTVWNTVSYVFFFSKTDRQGLSGLDNVDFTFGNVLFLRCGFTK